MLSRNKKVDVREGAKV